MQYKYETFLGEILNNLLLFNSIDINDSLKPTYCDHCYLEHLVKHSDNKLRCKACGKTQFSTPKTKSYTVVSPI